MLLLLLGFFRALAPAFQDTYTHHLRAFYNMPGTEKIETEQQQLPADFVRPPSRVANRVSLQPSTSSTIRLNSPRPASSIYSRSMDNYPDGQGSILAEADEKDPNRLNGWVHPAMRRGRLSISSLTSVSGMFGRLPSNDEQQHEQQQQQQQQTNRESVACSSYETCIENQPLSTTSNDDAEQQQGPIPPSSAATSTEKKRRCRLYPAVFSFICIAILVILIMCICMALGVFGQSDVSATRRRWVLSNRPSAEGSGETRPFIRASILPGTLGLPLVDD